MLLISIVSILLFGFLWSVYRTTGRMTNDSETEKAIQQSLAELSRGRTTLVIAHRLATIANADRIAVVENGHVVEQGSHAQLLARKDGRYRSLHGAQAAQSAPPSSPAVA